MLSFSRTSLMEPPIMHIEIKASSRIIHKNSYKDLTAIRNYPENGLAVAAVPIVALHPLHLHPLLLHIILLSHRSLTTIHQQTQTLHIPSSILHPLRLLLHPLHIILLRYRSLTATHQQTQTLHIPSGILHPLRLLLHPLHIILLRYRSLTATHQQTQTLHIPFSGSVHQNTSHHILPAIHPLTEIVSCPWILCGSADAACLRWTAMKPGRNVVERCLNLQLLNDLPRVALLEEMYVRLVVVTLMGDVYGKMNMREDQLHHKQLWRNG